MNTKLLLIALTAALGLCGCDQKQDETSMRQIKQLTQQISQLNQKIDTLTTNLARAEGSINFEMKADVSDLSTKITKSNSDQALRATALATVLEIQRQKISEIGDSVAKIDTVKLEADLLSLKTSEEFNRQRFQAIFDSELEVHKMLSEVSIKLHAY